MDEYHVKKDSESWYDYHMRMLERILIGYQDFKEVRELVKKYLPLEERYEKINE